MENHIVLFQSTNHYLQKFSVALVNFEKLTQQERRLKMAKRVNQRIQAPQSSERN